jgi:hypothetical protein
MPLAGLAWRDRAFRVEHAFACGVPDAVRKALEGVL